VVDVIKWDLAVSIGRRFIPSGPETSAHEATEIVAELREAAARAVDPVREVSLLHAPPDAHDAVVVGRPEWLRANVEQMRAATIPLADLLEEKGSAPLVREIGSRATAVQMGSVLAWLSSKVLGQYEAFAPLNTSGARGRLMLVAPNIVAAERQLGVSSTDFRLWVSLHEETHRVQFTAVPWLSEYFTGEVHDYLRATDTSGWETMMRTMRRLRESGATKPSLLDLVHTPEQSAILDRLTALMSLLEGHADVVMDEVGPEVVPTVTVIRERFEVRRHNIGTWDSVLRKALGLDAKMRQYVEGAAFVRGVIDEVGFEGFNAVWESPDSLPTLAEIPDPAAWVARVHA
jgi:coenzyme F420 biosynthesis associated uncharacterized protein